MGLGTFAAGPYSVTWNSVALGLVRADENNPILRLIHKGQRIEGTNNFGASLIGWIYTGRDVYWNAVLEEWNAGVKAALFPFGTDMGDIGTLGVDAYDLSHSLVLTAGTGSLAASNGPATITASKAVLAPDFNLDVPLSVNQRTVPISMALLPYLASSIYRNFSFT